MNKHFAAVIGAFLIPVAAFADDNSNCAPRNDMVKSLIEDHEAAPIVAGVDLSSGAPKMVELWATPYGEEWGLLTTDASGTSCLVLFGTKVRTAPYKGLNGRTNM